eukprot:scaffold321451_cov42-Prasinocladus_malaysianus.AAC.1
MIVWAISAALSFVSWSRLGGLLVRSASTASESAGLRHRPERRSVDAEQPMSKTPEGVSAESWFFYEYTAVATGDHPTLLQANGTLVDTV